METTIQETITCPVCRADSRHRYRKEGYRVARCSACNTLFIEEPPLDTAYLYDQSYFFGGDIGGYGSYDEEKEAMRGTFETCLDRIATYVPTGTLFDVGAATGYFLALAQKRGYRVSGIDISAAAAAEAQKKGIRVEVGKIEDTTQDMASVDVLTMFDVLEHVAHPDAFLKHATKLLKPGGIVMGCTPDSMSFTARLLGKRWHLLFPPEHLVLLNDKSLRILLEAQGFQVLWTGRITKRFSIPYILQTASRWLGIPVLGRLGLALRGGWLGRIAIPLDLRDNLFFIARRP